jgi:hypothetical protein
MRTLVVVAHAILAHDHLQMTLVDDKHPVEAFPAAAPDPTLGMRIGSGRHQRGQDHAGTLGLEGPVGFGRKLLVPIVDQNAELDPFLFELPAEIASSSGRDLASTESDHAR